MTNHLHPTITYFDVLDACAQPGCPICRIAQHVVHRYLDAILYEFVTDPGTRSNLKQSLGYCNGHAWMLPDLPGGYALGIALIYQDLLQDIGARLNDAHYDRAPAVSIRRLREALNPLEPVQATRTSVAALQAGARCPACEHRDTMVEIALQSMLEALARGDARMQTSLEASSGLCLAHLRRAMELSRDQDAFLRLIEISRKTLHALEQELQEFIRKCDYRYRDDKHGSEMDSWRRAVAWIAGQQGAL